MLLFLFIDSIEVAAIVGGIIFTVFFALVLNPPTKWLKPRRKDSSDKG